MHMARILLKLLLIILFIFVAQSFTNARISSDNGFDHICQIYTTIMQDPKNKNLSLGNKMDLIGSEIESSVKSKSAISAHEASMLAAPEDRYRILKEVAEHELKRPWTCEILRDWGSAQSVSKEN